MWARQHFDATIFPFKPRGICPQEEALELQQCTGGHSLQDFQALNNLN